MSNGITIREPQSADEMERLGTFLLAFFHQTGVDTTFGGFEDEVASMRGLYSPPRGALLMAVAEGGTILGAAAMRPLPGPGDCTLSGVIISEAARGKGLGRRLAACAIDRARAAGHRTMRVEAVEGDAAATALWQEFGFVPAPAYFPNPRPGSQHLALDLSVLD